MLPEEEVVERLPVAMSRPQIARWKIWYDVSGW